MSTDKITEKLKRMAEKELRDQAEAFVESLKEKYPRMYHAHGSTKLNKHHFYVVKKDGENRKIADYDSIEFHHSQTADLKNLIASILIGVYGKGLHNKKVNDLISKLEMFED